MTLLVAVVALALMRVALWRRGAPDTVTRMRAVAKANTRSETDCAADRINPIAIPGGTPMNTTHLHTMIGIGAMTLAAALLAAAAWHGTQGARVTPLAPYRVSVADAEEARQREQLLTAQPTRLEAERLRIVAIATAAGNSAERAEAIARELTRRSPPTAVAPGLVRLER
jgi:type IV secretory pathway TrbF-like protein